MGIKSDSQRGAADVFITTTNLLSLLIDCLFELLQVMIFLTLIIDKFRVLALLFGLAELNFNGPPGDNSFTLGQELTADYGLEE